MKRILFIICTLCFMLQSCDTDVENITVQTPPKGTPEYYENLRAYKKSEHQIVFGWFGGWKATGSSPVKYLDAVPDSVDFISIWGNAWQIDLMTPEMKEDMKYVQDVKGTKVTGTILLGWVGKMLDPEIVWPEDKHEALREYARQLAQMVIATGLQGLDIDYEPTIGGHDDVRDCPQGEDLDVFVEELGKYLGPKSGTDYLLVIDGQLNLVSEVAAPYFDFAISQAYNTSSPSSLQGRYDQIKTKFKPEQFIVCENFESLWSTGGVTYTDEKGNKMPSLLGMATWNPTQGQKGGCGSYHMEYEYNHSDNIDYKYLRRAIQIQNPAVK